ncbi:L,D-transpeptidase [Corynebacterium frankenforstense]|uniref:L,D-transpeptidase n=1 Tax=Corynebacterium frankenforstense TaxID=1230998 RepID=UPI00254B4E32|nr:L,D-transpeptidase [Corynebacterium frankenforstense]MDK6259933.1 L,D-transpeptidase [Corynebacterium frankenforstense]
MTYKPRHAKPSRARRRVGALLAGGAAAATLVAGPVNANAQTLSGPGSAELPQVGSSAMQLPADFQAQIDDLADQAREQAWDSRVWLHQQAAALPPEMQEPARQFVDQVVEGLFPGLIAQKNAEEAARVAAAEAAARPAPPAANTGVDTGPCPAQARACIDIDGGRTWLQDGGRVSYGPVPMSAGAPSPATATPKGTHFVNRKVKDEISHEFGNAPMPYSVYFTNTGVAFHQGNVNLLSHGCIHLNHDDAVTYFDQLQVGDMVYVY